MSIKETVNAALRQACDASARAEAVDEALAGLARLRLTDDERATAWS